VLGGEAGIPIFIVFGLTYYIVLKIILCLFLVAKARVPSVILSSWSVVLSGQIDVPKMSIYFITIEIWLWRLYFMQLLYEIISLKKFAMFKKRTFTYTSPVFFVFFSSAPAFLVPATVSCDRIPSVFIDNRMCLINIKFFLNNCCQSRFM
jgi:hypothetical protein